MYPLSDKDLDHLSREAAEQYDVESSASGWDQVEKRLNKVMPEQKERRRRFAWLLLLLALSGGAGMSGLLYFGNSPETAASASGRKETKSVPVTAANTDQMMKEPVTTEPSEVTAVTENKEDKSKNLVSPSNSKNAPSDRITNNPSQTLSSASGSFVRKKDAATGRSKPAIKNPAANDLARQGNNPLAGHPVQPTDAADPLKTRGSSPEVIADEADLKHRLPSTAAVVDPAIQVTASRTFIPSKEVLSIAANATAKQPAGKNKYRSPLAIGLVMGTDQSRIHGTSPGSLGWSGGLTAQYDLSKRLSVQTGFIITKKFYRATGKDFHPPLHYWTSYVNLQSVIGDCQMWDLPVQLRYDFYNTKNSRLFATAGVSNYIMRNQNYEYHYLNSNNVLTVKNWETYSQTNYWFGVMNLSAGIEKQLSRSMSFQVEPYVKLPLKGVGFGSMDISSYGVLLSVRYRPVFKQH